MFFFVTSDEKEVQDSGETDGLNENSSSSNDSNDLNEKYSLSDFRVAKSLAANQREKFCSDIDKPMKTKKRVSFNDSLVQVHLIPNISNIINIEKYRYYMRSPALAATMITSSPCTDLESETYYQVSYQTVDSKFVTQQPKENNESTRRDNIDENKSCSKLNNTEPAVSQQNTNENHPNQENVNTVNNATTPMTQESQQPPNDSIVTKGILVKLNKITIN